MLYTCRPNVMKITLKKRYWKNLNFRTATIIIFVILMFLIWGIRCLYNNNYIENYNLPINYGERKHFQLLVLILSAPANFQRRHTIRKTWLSERNEGLNFIFVIGTESLSAEKKSTLMLENETYNDLLLLENLKDTYNSITKKVLLSFTHFYENYHFDYLLKCDDDSYAFVSRIQKELIKWQNKSANRELYWGYFNGKAKVKKSGPWLENGWFLCDNYLPYALGGGYVLSYNLVKFIATNSNILKCYNSEDVSVGTWLAPLVNIQRWHDVRFNTGYRSRGCSNQYLVNHKQSVEEMNAMFEIYQKSGKACVQEVNIFPSYEYNWNVPASQCCKKKSQSL